MPPSKLKRRVFLVLLGGIYGNENRLDGWYDRDTHRVISGARMSLEYEYCRLQKETDTAFGLRICWWNDGYLWSKTVWILLQMDKLTNAISPRAQQKHTIVLIAFISSTRFPACFAKIQQKKSLMSLSMFCVVPHVKNIFVESDETRSTCCCPDVGLDVFLVSPWFNPNPILK